MLVPLFTRRMPTVQPIYFSPFSLLLTPSPDQGNETLSPTPTNYSLPLFPNCKQNDITSQSLSKRLGLKKARLILLTMEGRTITRHLEAF